MSKEGKGKKRYKAFELRRNIWRCFAILKNIKISDLVCIIPGLGRDNARKVLRTLEIHGYVGRKEADGRMVFDRAVLIPLLPPHCGHCGAAFGEKSCDLSKKEKEKEKEKELTSRIEREKARPESRFNKPKKAGKKDGWRPPVSLRGPRPSEVKDDAA